MSTNPIVREVLHTYDQATTLFEKLKASAPNSEATAREFRDASMVMNDGVVKSVDLRGDDLDRVQAARERVMRLCDEAGYAIAQRTWETNDLDDFKASVAST